MTQETTTPYPTLEDKIELFKQYGFKATDYYKGIYGVECETCETCETCNSPLQIIRFQDGSRDFAERAVAIATEHGIEVIELTYILEYRSHNQFRAAPFWTITFDDYVFGSDAFSLC